MTKTINVGELALLSVGPDLEGSFFIGRVSYVRDAIFGVIWEDDGKEVDYFFEDFFDLGKISFEKREVSIIK